MRRRRRIVIIRRRRRKGQCRNGETEMRIDVYFVCKEVFGAWKQESR
jgi:hypothetical protein